MSVYPKLTCCGGHPRSCQQLYNVSSCPAGMSPQFCCNTNGELTPATMSRDSSFNVITVCPNLGDVPTDTYNSSACQKLPVTNCCKEGFCYQSKDSECQWYGAFPPRDGGNSVTECSKCTPPSTSLHCCVPFQCSVYDKKSKSSCDQGSYPVPDCSMCPGY